MGVIEAQNLLGIHYPFTEEDLKKRYRELSKQNHPDLNPDLGSEKMQIINEAYKTVCDYYFEKDKKNDALRAEYSKYTELDVEEGDTSKVVAKYKERLSRIVKEQVRKIIDLDSTFYKELLKSFLISNIYDEYRSFVINYFKENLIDDKYRGKICYDCSFQELYNYVLNLKKKYGKKYLFNQKLDELLEEYKNNPLYLKIKQYIDNSIRLISNKELVRIADLDKYISELKIKIDELISKYNNYFKTVGFLKNCLSHLYNDSQLACILNLLEIGTTKEYIQNNTGVSLEDISLYLKLIDIENKYNSKDYGLSDSLDISTIFDSEYCFSLIYRSLVKEYSESLIACSGDVDRTMHLNEVWTYLSLLLINNKNRLDIDMLLAISSISFDNLEEASNIINNIFMQMDIKYSFEKKRLFVGFGNKVYSFSKNVVFSSTENLDISKIGISIDYLIDNSEYIGISYTKSNNIKFTKLLKYTERGGYTWKDLYFYVNEKGIIRISENQLESRFDESEENDNPISKEDFIWLLKKQLYKAIMEYEASLDMERNGSGRK